MKSVLVLGNARSGTSMAAGICTILGVRMMEWMPSDYPYPPYETFEHVGLNRVFESMELEEKAGSSMHEIATVYAPRLKSLLDQYAEGVWGFKHTVTHRYLSMVLPLVQNPHLLVVSRDLRANAESWVRQMREQYGTNIDPWHAYCVMLESKLRLEESVGWASAVPVLRTTYDALRASPVMEAERLARFLDVPFSVSDAGLVRMFVR